MKLTGRCAQTWTWTGLILRQREASSTACSEERQVLVLRQLSEGVGAKVLALFLPSFFSLQALSKLNMWTPLKCVVLSYVTTYWSWFEQGLSFSPLLIPLPFSLCVALLTPPPKKKKNFTCIRSCSANRLFLLSAIYCTDLSFCFAVFWTCVDLKGVTASGDRADLSLLF